MKKRIRKMTGAVLLSAMLVGSMGAVPAQAGSSTKGTIGGKG